jgi:hypothetical protein
MRERGARWRVRRVLSECSLSLTVTQNEHLVDPRGEPAGLCFGYRLGTGVPPWGPPPHAGAAVHRYGSTALHYAAEYGNRRIVRSLVDANADVNGQDHFGCAVCACGESAECAGRVPAAVGRAGSRRCTSPRSVAVPHASRSCCCAAPTGPSGPSTGNAALRRTAETETLNSRARAGPCRSKSRNGLGSSRPTRRGRGRCTPPAASRPTPSLLPRAPSLPALLVPSVFAVGDRRSSGEGGNSPRSTRTVTSARAARLFAHYCTRGSKCRENRARAAAAIGSAKCARARSAVPLTAMWDRRVLHANARATRRSASSPFRPLSRRI